MTHTNATRVTTGESAYSLSPQPIPHREDIGTLDRVITQPSSRIIPWDGAVSLHYQVRETPPLPACQLQRKVYVRPRGRHLHLHFRFVDRVRAVVHLRAILLQHRRDRTAGGIRFDLVPSMDWTRGRTLNVSGGRARQLVIKIPTSLPRMHAPTSGLSLSAGRQIQYCLVFRNVTQSAVPSSLRNLPRGGYRAWYG